MGRRKIDPGYREAHRRLLQILNDDEDSPIGSRSQFIKSFRILKEMWASAGKPAIMQDRKISIDSHTGRFEYRGFYYQIRDLCDEYVVNWPHGGYIIAGAMHEGDNGADISGDFRIPLGLPKRDHLRWFRVAKEGLRMPRQEEIDMVRDITPKGWKIDKSEGLTYELIADLHMFQTGEEFTDRAVGSAVRGCWKFLETEANLDLVADYAGFTDLETLGMAWALAAHQAGAEYQET